MFIKKSWSTYNGKRSVQFHLAESYRDPATGKPRHRMLANLTPLPPHALEAVRSALKTGRPSTVGDLQLHTGDALRGAGVLSVWRSWQHESMDTLFPELSAPERRSVLCMVMQRILEPGSKLALQTRFADTLPAWALPAKRLDENELYRVMDLLHNTFYAIQRRLRKRQGDAPLLCLYDITSTYFEGVEAEEGEYGHSRDKRWDRFQIVIGLVVDADGVPVAVETWPGNTQDKTTVVERVKALKETFGIKKALFVGDAGMYSEANVEAICTAGFDYILNTDFQTQRAKLEALGPVQLGLFDEHGVVEWVQDGARYVGCLSEMKRARAAKRREQGIAEAEAELKRLAETAAKGRYYSWARLWSKAEAMLKDEGVHGLLRVEIAYADPEHAPDSPDKKAILRLTFTPDADAIAKRAELEGKFVLRTSLSSADCSADRVRAVYNELQLAERAFRHIKTYLRLRPVHHYRRRRIRAHVLLCFLAFYLVKRMEGELHAHGVHEEVERLLRRWDQLHVVETRVQIGDHEHRDWQWSLGEIGKAIQEEIERVGWWASIDAHRRSLTKSATA